MTSRTPAKLTASLPKLLSDNNLESLFLQTLSNPSLNKQSILTLTPLEACKFTKIGRLNFVMPQVIVFVLVDMILELADAMNTTRNISPETALDASRLILTDWKVFSLEDLAVCFKRAKTGQYGNTYGTFSIPVLFEFLQKYNLERDREIEQDNLTLKKLNDAPISSKVAEAILQHLPQISKEEFNEDEYQRLKAEYLKKKNDNQPKP